MRRLTSAASPTTSTPATRALPAVGGRRVQRMRTVVVLPAPFGPRKPKISPGAMNRSIPRTASTPPLKVRFRSCVWMASVPSAMRAPYDRRARPYSSHGLVDQDRHAVANRLRTRQLQRLLARRLAEHLLARA